MNLVHLNYLILAEEAQIFYQLMDLDEKILESKKQVRRKDLK